MKQAELVFIPATALSHIMAAVATATLLLNRAERRLSATLLIMNPTKDITIDTYTQKISASSSNPHLKFITLPVPDGPLNFSITSILEYIESRVADVRQIISNLVKQDPYMSHVTGLVLDICTTNFIDVANEFGLPSYVFHPCSACYLGISLHPDTTKSEHDTGADDFELPVPYFSVAVPAKVLPGRKFPDHEIILRFLKRLPEVRGIMVNTFHEFEPYAIDSLMSEDDGPKIYPVSPVLNSGCGEEDEDVKKWLDEQPEKSVVFLCFGSIGSLVEAQVREISLSLENSGFRFLWSLRNGEGMLPEGFLERTKGVGRVIGWAAQAAVLAHAAVGCFVSHCGWNSTLESVWFGVPMAAFPLFAEQHLNAFEMVEEVGVAEAVTLDYHMDFGGGRTPEIVGAEEIEAAIRRVMEAEGSGVRGKVEEMRRKGRAALEEGGSSYEAQTLFIEDVIANIIM